MLYGTLLIDDVKFKKSRVLYKIFAASFHPLYIIFVFDKLKYHSTSEIFENVSQKTITRVKL